MGAERVHIGELKIRVPGLSQSAARELGRQVEAEIAAGLPPGRAIRHLGAVHIRVTMPAGAALDEMPAAIARAILGSLR
jgi:hypothetical protein